MCTLLPLALCGPGGMDSGPHNYMTSILPTELAPQPLLPIYYFYLHFGTYSSVILSLPLSFHSLYKITIYSDHLPSASTNEQEHMLVVSYV